MHAALARARASDDRDAARALVARLAALYEGRAETARARAEVAEARAAIVDGRDLIDIAERALLTPLDRKRKPKSPRRRAASRWSRRSAHARFST